MDGVSGSASCSEGEIMAPGKGLTREKILATALRLIDEEGLPALSMRRLGQELGVEAMALYKYVASKQALLDGVVGLTLAGLNATADGSSGKSAHEAERSHIQGDLTAIFRSLRALLQQHPNVLPLLASRPFGSTEGLSWAEEAVGRLRSVRLAEGVVLSSFHALLGYTLGYAFLEAGGFVGDIPETEPLLRANLREMAKQQGPLVPGLADYPDDWDHEDDFTAGLGLIVAGAMVAASGSAKEVRVGG
jgi:AcrR family transcriptional regulator